MTAVCRIGGFVCGIGTNSFVTGVNIGVIWAGVKIEGVDTSEYVIYIYQTGVVSLVCELVPLYFQILFIDGATFPKEIFK